MSRREQIKNAYKLTGGHASFYDGISIRKKDSSRRLMRQRKA